MDDLGTANLWKETPKIIEKCHKEKHFEKGYVKESTSWNCYHSVKCEKCNYYYEYDSSG